MSNANDKDDDKDNTDSKEFCFMIYRKKGNIINVIISFIVINKRVVNY